MQGVQRIRRWPRGPRPSPRFARSRCLPTARRRRGRNGFYAVAAATSRQAQAPRRARGGSEGRTRTRRRRVYRTHAGVAVITGVASLVGIPASCSLAALTCFRFFLSSCAHVVFFPLMGWGFRNRIYMAHKKIFRNPWRYQKCMIHSHGQLSVELELRQRDNNEAPLALHAADEMFHSWQLRAWPSCLQQVAARPGSRN